MGVNGGHTRGRKGSSSPFYPAPDADVDPQFRHGYLLVNTSNYHQEVVEEMLPWRPRSLTFFDKEEREPTQWAILDQSQDPWSISLVKNTNKEEPPWTPTS